MLDAAVLLAADVEGVEAAESAIDSLREALAPFAGPSIGSRIRWRSFQEDEGPIRAVLAAPLASARAELDASDMAPVVLARASRLEREVTEALEARFPRRPLLASEIAHAAFVDFVWRATSWADRLNPTTSLREIWEAGYAIASIEASCVTLELPGV
jgi:hypothetical protein